MPTCTQNGLSHISDGTFDFLTAIWCGLSGGFSGETFVALFVFGGVMIFFTVLTRSIKIPAVMMVLLGTLFVTRLTGPAVGMAVMLMVFVAGGAIFYLTTKARGSL